MVRDKTNLNFADITGTLLLLLCMNSEQKKCVTLNYVLENSKWNLEHGILNVYAIKQKK